MSFQPTKILVPIDTDAGSDPVLARATVEQACDLAAPFGARLFLISVVVPPAMPTGFDTSFDYGGLMQGVLEQRTTEARRRLEDFRHLAEQRSIAADIEVVSDALSVPATIAERAKALDVDLIALTTHGRMGVTRVLLGSVAERVAHIAHVPVLLFRAPSDSP